MSMGKDGKYEWVRYISITDHDGLEFWETPKRIIAKIGYFNWLGGPLQKDIIVGKDYNISSPEASRLIPAQSDTPLHCWTTSSAASSTIPEMVGLLSKSCRRIEFG